MNVTVHLNMTKFRYINRTIRTHTYSFVCVLCVCIATPAVAASPKRRMAVAGGRVYPLYPPVLQCVAVCCSVLQAVVVALSWALQEVEYTPCGHLCCSAWFVARVAARVAVCCNVPSKPSCTHLYCSTLQYCCSTLQYCCSTLQYFCSVCYNEFQ